MNRRINRFSPNFLVRELSPTNFQTQEIAEKIYYKCIPLCSFVCLELSFKASESLKNF